MCQYMYTLVKDSNDDCPFSISYQQNQHCVVVNNLQQRYSVQDWNVFDMWNECTIIICYLTLCLQLSYMKCKKKNLFFQKKKDNLAVLLKVRLKFPI